ncbi:MAG: hypothetical protein J6S21_02335 [Victivallales bacterium]|nr:hypothetical protein [Victivallales bacterium]
MLTLIIMLAVAVVAAFFTDIAGDGGHWGWAILSFLGGALAVAVPMNLWIRKKLNVIFNRIQQQLMDSNAALQRKAQAMQNKGMGGPALMAKFEKEQADAIRNVLPMLDEVNPLGKWNMLAVKQANMLRGQLLFQIRDYEGARAMLEGSMLVAEPSLFCMQMVLHYRKDNTETAKLDAMFKKGVARFKYDRATLIYALYSWILVKQNRLTEAVTALDEGKKKTEHPVIIQNWQHLANNHAGKFSNAGLGEQWYVLGLEQPVPVRQRQQMPFGGGRPGRGMR